MPPADDVAESLCGIRHVADAAGFTDAQLADALTDEVWGQLAWKSWPEALVAEAIRRLEDGRRSP